MTTLEHARAYLAAGWSLIPVGLDGSKQPAFAALPHEWDEAAGRGKATWKPFQTRPPSADDLARWFGGGRAWGIALVYGAVSGGAELIDFDDPDLFDPWLSLVRSELGDDFADSLAVVRTPGGRHVVYRCAAPAGNLALARRAAGEPGDAKLIETRGEGGYALAPGSPAQCHPSGGAYEHAAGRPLTDPPLVTDAERHVMLTLARSFNRRLDAGQARSAHAPDGADGRPGSDFDRRATLREVLEPAGWALAAGAWDHGHLRRPGKDRGVSASVGHARGRDGAPLLWVFSTSTPFEAGAWYGPFRAYAALHHGGDPSAAARTLAGRGYGTPAARPGGRAGTNGHAPAPGVPAEPAPEPWPVPVPLDDCAPPPLFPASDVFPVELAHYAGAVAAATNCPVDYPGALMLGAAAGAVGASAVAQVKPGYVERSSLFVCVLAPPGAGKSPVYLRVTAPFMEERRERLRAGDDRELVVGDITAESLADVLKRNPRGLLMARDELAGWVLGLNQYKAKGVGGDRAFYLAVWAGEPVSVHRKNQEDGAVFVPHPCLSVVGGLQPARLPELRSLDDGFIDRILFACPTPRPAQGEDWKSIDPAAERPWGNALARLWGSAMVEGEHGPRPFFHRLTHEAEGVWEEFTALMAAELNDPDFPAHLRGPWAKLTGYAVRLALVCHRLRWACGERVGPELDGESLWRGCRLADYFRGHAQRVYGLLGRDPRIQDARRVLNWIQGGGLEEFSRRDAWRGLRKSFDKPEDLLPPLKLLVQAGYLRWIEPPPQPQGGRPPSNALVVNPLLKTQEMGDTGDKTPSVTPRRPVLSPVSPISWDLEGGGEVGF